MLLVPRQLRRAGMTGNVPYYGGRFSPAQAYAASHPTAPPPSTMGPPIPTDVFSRAPLPEAGGLSSRQGAPADIDQALQQLLSAGVITQAEFNDLRSRATR